jgi:hypothetical protein
MDLQFSRKQTRPRLGRNRAHVHDRQQHRLEQRPQQPLQKTQETQGPANKGTNVTTQLGARDERRNHGRRSMTTKTVQAQHLHVGDEIVDGGGDGVRRTRHRIQELKVNRASVTAVARTGETFQTLQFEPLGVVRIVKVRA